MKTEQARKDKVKQEKISESGFVRKISLFDATLFVMGSVLGSGIFMTSGHMMSYLGNEKLMLLTWLFGGFFTMAGGLCLAELGIRFPQAGGPYIYLREAYGEWAGFFFGWIFFWIIEGGGIAALSAGFISHFQSLIGTEDWTLLKVNFWRGHGLNIMFSQLMAFLPILLLSTVNHYGIKLGILIQNLSMLVRASLLITFLSMGFLRLKQKGLLSLANIDSAPLNTGGFEAIFLAMLAALWTFDGWYAANCTAEEMKKPEKDLPRAVILGLSGILLIYLTANIFYALALRGGEMAGKERIGELAARVVFGPKASVWMTAGIAFTIFGCLSATIIYGPRVYFAMARDKLFFEGLGKLHARTRVPSRGIWAQAVWSSLLCLVGRFQSLYEYVVFSLLLFFAGIGGAFFITKKKQANPGKNGEYNSSRKMIVRNWLIGSLTIFFLTSGALIYTSSLIWKTKETLLGLAIVLSGWPAYIYWQKKKKKEKCLEKDGKREWENEVDKEN
ncbi:MAG: APC family permease [Candidatus Aminicenantales bacterium]